MLGVVGISNYYHGTKLLINSDVYDAIEYKKRLVILYTCINYYKWSTKGVWQDHVWLYNTGCKVLMCLFHKELPRCHPRLNFHLRKKFLKHQGWQYQISVIALRYCSSIIICGEFKHKILKNYFLKISFRYISALHCIYTC